MKGLAQHWAHGKHSVLVLFITVIVMLYLAQLYNSFLKFEIKYWY